VHEYHPPRIDEMSEEEIRDQIVRDVLEGAPDPGLGAETPGMVESGMGWPSTGIRSGLIGEIGLTWPVHPNERKVLRASAQAQVASGAPMTIHPGRNPQAPMDAIRTVEDAGGDLSRTVMGHLDRTVFELDGLLELAQTGCYLEFDLFGWQESFYPLAPVDLPNDGIRANWGIWIGSSSHMT
jgi:phosphotriesterase-related protein